MATDESIIGRMAAELMEQIEASYGEEAEITAALLIVNVDHGDGQQETVHIKASPGLARYQGIGLVEWTKRTFSRAVSEAFKLALAVLASTQPDCLARDRAPQIVDRCHPQFPRIRLADRR
jgi:hypothetical protein